MSSKQILQAMKQLSNQKGQIAALAIDQRGALKKMLTSAGFQGDEQVAIEKFKSLVSEELTPYASSILLDPEYGLPASQVKNKQAGLLLAYEKTGYDTTVPGRLPDLIENISAKRIKEAGADAVKFLLYYDIDESDKINDIKKAFVERMGSECMAEDIPFYLELVSYDSEINDTSSTAYAKVKPHKVNEMMKVFSDARYRVAVLKVEVPVNMNFVEGFTTDTQVVYTKAEAKAFFKEQSQATTLPFIFLSAGVSSKMFQDTLLFAREAESTFNGVLCGRATWADGVAIFAKEGEEVTRAWLQTQGKTNIEELNDVLERTATPWTDKLD